VIRRELACISYWTCSKLMACNRLPVVLIVIMYLCCNHCDVLRANYNMLIYTALIFNKPLVCIWQMSWLLLSVRFSPHCLLPLRKFSQLLLKRGNSALQSRQVVCYKVWWWEMEIGFSDTSWVHEIYVCVVNWTLWCKDIKTCRLSSCSVTFRGLEVNVQSFLDVLTDHSLCGRTTFTWCKMKALIVSCST